jgi:hypothetical protein
LETYIYSPDGLEFSSKEELMDYVSSKHIVVLDSTEEKGLSIEKIYKSFKVELPEDVEIRSQSDVDDGGYLVHLTSDVCDFSFQVGEGESNYYYYRFPELGDAIKFYKNYFITANEIIEKVKNVYSLEITANRMRDGGEDFHSYDNILFEFNIDGNQTYEEFEFKGEDIEKFIRRFDQYFATSLEGQFEKITKEYTTEFYINGIPIDGFIGRGKKYRLEIIE